MLVLLHLFSTSLGRIKKNYIDLYFFSFCFSFISVPLTLPSSPYSSVYPHVISWGLCASSPTLDSLVSISLPIYTPGPSTPDYVCTCVCIIRDDIHLGRKGKTFSKGSSSSLFHSTSTKKCQAFCMYLVNMDQYCHQQYICQNGMYVFRINEGPPGGVMVRHIQLSSCTHGLQPQAAVVSDSRSAIISCLTIHIIQFSQNFCFLLGKMGKTKISTSLHVCGDIN